MTRSYYPTLDWIRLLLATQVVFIHAGICDRVLISPVPAFLAVSGFAVYGSVQRWPVSQFFINRALRVLPLLFVSFGVVYLLFGQAEMVKTVLYWLWPGGDIATREPINAPVWSLVFEEFFYALLVVLFLAGLYRFKIFPIVAAALCFALVSTGTTLNLPRPFFVLGGAFFMGNCFYIFREHVEKVPPIVATALFAGVLLLVPFGPYTSILRPDYALVDFASFAALLTFGIAGPRLPKLALDLSYSLYLLHCIVRGLLLGHVPLGWTMFALLLLITLPLCVVSWYAIERPALKLKTWRPAWKPARAG